jgi:hypothetical protein
MNFVDGLPPDGRGGPVADYDIAELRANLGRWAENARYPLPRRSAASSLGRGQVARHDGIEYATRTVGEEVVVYLRAVSA